MDPLSAEAIEYMDLIFPSRYQNSGRKVLPFTGAAGSVSVCSVLFAVKWAFLKHVFLLHQELGVVFVFIYYKNLFICCVSTFFFLLECPIHWGLENLRVSCLSSCPLPLSSLIVHSYSCPAHLCRNQPFLFGHPNTIHKDSRKKHCSASRSSREETDAAAWISHAPRCWVW